ncbi:MAG: hypothetical protein JWQ71_886, partial [Pedosphaera sp.]|nr:hypothetical protein [Pedosphaera sp.]
ANLQRAMVGNSYMMLAIAEGGQSHMRSGLSLNRIIKAAQKFGQLTTV